MTYTAKDFQEFEQESLEEIDAEFDMLKTAIRKRNYEMIANHAKNIMVEAIKAERYDFVAYHIA